MSFNKQDGRAPQHFGKTTLEKLAPGKYDTVETRASPGFFGATTAEGMTQGDTSLLYDDQGYPQYAGKVGRGGAGHSPSMRHAPTKNIMLGHLPRSTRAHQKQQSTLSKGAALKNPLNHLFSTAGDGQGGKRSRSELYSTLLAFFEDRALQGQDGQELHEDSLAGTGTMGSGLVATRRESQKEKFLLPQVKLKSSRNEAQKGAGAPLAATSASTFQNMRK